MVPALPLATISNDNSLDAFFLNTRNIVTDPCISYEQDEQELEQVSGENLEAAVNNFAKSYFNQEIQVKSVAAVDATKGVSGAPVYFICTADIMLGVAKAFLKIQELLDECTAVEILSSLWDTGRLAENQQVIEVYKIGKFICENRPHYLMLQSVAAGDGLDDQLRKYFYEDKKDLLAKMSTIIAASAKVFGTLHKGSKSSSDAVIEEYITSIYNMLERIQEFEAFDLRIYERLDNCVKKIHALIQATKNDRDMRGSIIHGDSHPGNIFADYIEGNPCKITFIDTPSLMRSILDKAQLLGKAPGMRDFSNFLVRMGDIYIRCMVAQRPLPSLKDEKYREIKKIFKLEYCKSFDEQINRTHRDMQAVRSLLGTIFRCYENLAGSSKVFNSSMIELRVMLITISELEHIVNTYKEG